MADDYSDVNFLSPDDINKAIDSPGGFTQLGAQTAPYSPAADPGQQSWSDLGSDVWHTAVASGAGTLGGIARGLEFATDSDQYRNLADYYSDYQKQQQEQISPAGQAINAQPIWQGWSHPISKIAQTAAGMAPQIAPAFIPGIGEAAEAGVLATTGAISSQAAHYNEVYDGIKNTADDVLQKNNSTYLDLRQKGMSEYDAKDQLAKMAIHNAPLWEELVPAITGAMAGVGGVPGKVAGVSSIGGNIAERMLGTGAVQAAGAAGQELPSRQILTQQGADVSSPSQALTDIGSAAVMGGAFGLLPASKEHAPLKGGEFQGVRSGREYPKPEVEQQEGEKVTTVAPGEPDPAQAQALGSATQEPNIQQEPPQPTGEQPPSPTPPPPTGEQPPPPTAAPPTAPPTPPPAITPPQPAGIHPELVARTQALVKTISDQFPITPKELTINSDTPAIGALNDARKRAQDIILANPKVVDLVNHPDAQNIPNNPLSPAADFINKAQDLANAPVATATRVTDFLQAQQRFIDSTREREGAPPPTGELAATPTPPVSEPAPVPSIPSKAAAAVATAKRAPVEGPEVGKPKLAKVQQLEATPGKEAANVEPTPAQTEAGNYQKAHGSVQGHPISIETPKGAIRRGISALGKAWSAVMKSGDYGHLIGHRGADGDPVDALVIKHPEPGSPVHVINQLNTKTGEFDEHKVVFGAKDRQEAINSYLANFDSKIEGQRHLGGVVEMPEQEFNNWLEKGDKSQPAHETVDGAHPLGEVEVAGGKKLQVTRSSTLRQELSNIKLPNTGLYSIVSQLRDHFLKYIPDVPVHYADRSEYLKVHSPSNGFYDPDRNHIVINNGARNPDMTLMHEAAHAATVYSYWANPKFRAAADKIFAEMKDYMTKNNIKPASPNMYKSEEILADIVRPEVAQQLRSIPISADLAKELGLASWKKKSVWNGILKSFGDALGFKSMSNEHYNALDGLLSLNDKGLMARSDIAKSNFGQVLKQSRARVKPDLERPQEEIARTTLDDMMNHPSTIDSDNRTLDDSIQNKVKVVLRGITTADYGSKGEQFVWGKAIKLAARDVLRMEGEKYFQKGTPDDRNPLRRDVDLKDQRDVRKSELIKKASEQTANEAEMKRKYPQQWPDYVKLREEARRYGVYPNEGLGKDTRNAHLGEAPDPDDPNLNFARSQAVQNHPRLAEAFHSLPEDLQKTMVNEFDSNDIVKDKVAKLNAQSLIDTIDKAGKRAIDISKIDPKDKDELDYANWHNKFEADWDKNKAGFMQRMIDGKLSTNEKEWAQRRGIIDNANDLKDFAKPQGPYVPLDRFGDIVLPGRYKVDAPEGPHTKINENTYEFKTREQAHAYMKEINPGSRVEIVYRDDQGNKVSKDEAWQRPDGTVGKATDNKSYQVHVNDRHFSSYDNLAHARAAEKEMLDNGILRESSGPQTKEQFWDGQTKIAPAYIERQMRMIDRRDDMTPEDKEMTKQNLMDAHLRNLDGNRIDKRFIDFKNVGGASDQIIKSNDLYRRAMATLMSRMEFSKQLGEAHKAMEDYHRENQGDKDTYKRSVIINELADRERQFNSPDTTGGLSPKISANLNRLHAISFIENMFSPAHLLVHATHPIYSTGLMASRYGAYKAMGVSQRRLTMLGGGAVRGLFKSVKEMRDIITKDSKGGNYIEGLVNDLVKNDKKYGEEMKDLFDWAAKRGAIDPEQGFDSEMFHETAGKFDRILEKAQRFISQTMAAGDAFNRVHTLSSVYELARDAGKSVEEARQEAKDFLSQSQGLLTRSNMAPIFNKWYTKPMMQFKGWGFGLATTIVRSAYKAFKGESRAERMEAVRRLAYLFGTAFALTGVSGMPNEPLKLVLSLAGAFGLTNFNYADMEQKLREKLTDTMGSTVSNIFMHGLTGALGPFAFNGGDRIGLGSLLLYGEPKSYKWDDVSKWVGQTVMGASGDVVGRMWQGRDKLLSGDIAGAIPNMIPVKLIGDIAKAYEGATSGQPTKTGIPGMRQYNIGETILQGLGFVPLKRSEYGEARSAVYREETQMKDQKSSLLDNYAKATTKGDQLKAIQAIKDYNMSNPTNRITQQSIAGAGKRATGPSILGQKPTKATRPLLQRIEQSYGGGF